MNKPLLPLADAQKILLTSAQKLPIERINIAKSLGRITSDEIISLRNQPAADMSAMDGYAIKYDGATSWEIAGECRAGYPPCREIQTGQAARIFTGALLPKGADTVIIQENIDIGGGRASLSRAANTTKGQNIRSMGNDFKKDDVIVKAGTIITPAMIGLLIAAGHAQIYVHKKPNIAIISTGDELQLAGISCEDHQIPASNGLMIEALIEGCHIAFNDIIPDDLDIIIQCINDHKDCDIIISIGGASVGDHDLIIPALTALNADINFMKAAIKPGKPVLTARLGATHILGLPGNPSSAFVTTILFVLPLIKYMGGAAHYMPVTKWAKNMTNLGPNGPRAEYLRAQITNDEITAFPSQDSAKLSTLAIANALLIRPSHAEICTIGTQVQYIPI